METLNVQLCRKYLMSDPNKASLPCNRTFSLARLRSIGHNICAMGGKLPCGESIHRVKNSGVGKAIGNRERKAGARKAKFANANWLR